MSQTTSPTLSEPSGAHPGGLPPFTGLILGSVTHHVAHHASCPVVVVP
jgi:nucleotide-binding universal stress UspA family protein